MRTFIGVRGAILATVAAAGFTLSADDDIDESKIQKASKVVIIGDRETAKKLAGSGNVVPPKQMSVEAITDIHQAMKTVPGVYVREEEGFGLRPNIGIRAAAGNRSSRITLMEDGVLMAPAPYAAPAAYYFPVATRMSFVEVMKGAPMLRYGPYTTGGAVNLVSTAIPENNQGFLSSAVGSFGSSNLHGFYGATEQDIGWLVELVERNSDGFKSIDGDNRSTGFNESDFVGKWRWRPESGTSQELLLKVQRSMQQSDETYLGLTEADFARDPNRRYGMTALDQMRTEHTGLSLSYAREINQNADFNLVVYRNEFSRNWYKLGGAFGLIQAANSGDANAQAILDGTVDTQDLSYKMNARDFFSQGVELNFRFDWLDHLLEVGSRFHSDETDRYQPIDIFDQINGSLVYQETLLPGASDNRIGKADAKSFWIKDQWTLTDRATLNMMLRYEDVDTTQTRFSTPDRLVVDQQRNNSVSEWMPGISMTYQMSDRWQAIAGVHAGFSPLGAGATENERPETSTNWELGARYQGEELFAEAILFVSDFADKEELCTLGTPCSNGATSGRFITGEALVSGLELQLSRTFRSESLSIPVDLAYTFTDAEIVKTNPVSSVTKGDDLKDIPEQVASLRVGFETGGDWNHYASIKYISETCNIVGCNNSSDPLVKTEDLTVIDWVSRVKLTESSELFFKLENIADEQVVISRVPEGPRPNKPRSLWMGIDISL